MAASEAIVLHEHGGPEVLRLASIGLDQPAVGEVLLRHTAIGVNFHDCYVRSGLYSTLDLPGVPGLEAVGVIEAIGPDVTGYVIGERIGWMSPAYGGYASHRVLPVGLALSLPDSLTDAQAAASLMKAMTVSVLVRRVHVVGPGQRVLVHAGAGGVGQLLCNWCNHLGAEVIATVGSPDKVAMATQAGAHTVINYAEEDFVEHVRSITNGDGVDVVYDAVGRDTFSGSLDCLGFEGTLVNYGQASGPVAPFTPAVLAARSLKLARPVVFHYARTEERLRALARDAFDAFDAGFLHPVEPLQIPLAEAAEAHRLLEARQSPGGIVLIPRTDSGQGC